MHSKITLSELEIQRNFLHFIKISTKKLTPNIIFKGEKLKAFPKKCRDKSRIFPFATLFSILFKVKLSK